MSDPVWAKITIVVINIWVGVPYLMLIATGVLMNIPEELKESAKIDGANSFQIFRKDHNAVYAVYHRTIPRNTVYGKHQ